VPLLEAKHQKEVEKEITEVREGVEGAAEAMDVAVEVLTEVGDEDEAMTNTIMDHAQPRPSHMVISLPFYLELLR